MQIMSRKPRCYSKGLKASISVDRYSFHLVVSCPASRNVGTSRMYVIIMT